MTSHAYNDITHTCTVYTVSDTHIHTHTQSHTSRYHSGGDKTHAVRGGNAISARRAGKSLKVDFHGQQWDNHGSDGRCVHRIHGDLEGIGGLLKQYHVPLAITEDTAHRRGLHPLTPTYKLNMTDEF